MRWMGGQQVGAGVQASQPPQRAPHTQAVQLRGSEINARGTQRGSSRNPGQAEINQVKENQEMKTKATSKSQEPTLQRMGPSRRLSH